MLLLLFAGVYYLFFLIFSGDSYLYLQCNGGGGGSDVAFSVLSRIFFFFLSYIICPLQLQVKFCHNYKTLKHQHHAATMRVKLAAK